MCNGMYKQYNNIANDFNRFQRPSRRRRVRVETPDRSRGAAGRRTQTRAHALATATAPTATATATTRFANGTRNGTERWVLKGEESGTRGVRRRIRRRRVARAMSPMKVKTKPMSRSRSLGNLSGKPKVATNVTVLAFTNLGLLSFFLGGVYFVIEGWDQTAICCVIGYVSCGVALAVPSLTFASSEEDEEVFMEPATPEHDRMVKDERSRHWWRVGAGILNVMGLLLGILGSLLYSPAFIEFWTNRSQNEEQFERVTDHANVIWAVSFILFPLGSGLFLLDRKKTLDTRAELTNRPKRGYFSQELYLYTWIEIALTIFAVGGLFFCFDDNSASLVLALVLFFIGGGIKAGLMFHELTTFFGARCDEPRDMYSPDENSRLVVSSDASPPFGSASGDDFT